MKALLMTRCGCTREFEVTYPPPPSVMIPLNGRELRKSFFSLPPDDPISPMRTRTFELTRPLSPGPSSRAYYTEAR